MTATSTHRFISVVVPFHDSADYIERCLTALEAQEYPRDRFEILMVDNNSTDRSADIVGGHPAVSLLHEARPGAYAARNRGVEASTGDVIAFTDADCAPAPGWLVAISEAMSCPGTMLVQGPVRFGIESIGLSPLADYEASKAAYTFSSDNAGIYYGYAGNMAADRRVFAKAGRFEAWIRGADALFVHQVIETCGIGAITYSPAMGVRHLEVTSVRKWLQKLVIYGKNFQAQRKRVAMRPMSAADRLAILRNTFRDNRYSSLNAILLLLFLCLGGLAYEWGRRMPAHASPVENARGTP